MSETPKIQHVFLDFGGCIDSDGVHSRTLFREAFEKEVGKERIRNDIFQDAYSIADQIINQQGLALGMRLADFNLLMVELIADTAGLAGEAKGQVVADHITEVQSHFLRRNKPILKKLNERYQLGIVSNFTGNLEDILTEFDLREFFCIISESFHVGFSKPDARLFKNALEGANAHPHQSVFVGDNLERDILPARSLGMHTIWLHSPLSDTVADACIQDFRELPEVIQKIYPMTIHTSSTKR